MAQTATWKTINDTTGNELTGARISGGPAVSFECSNAQERASGDVVYSSTNYNGTAHIIKSNYLDTASIKGSASDSADVESTNFWEFVKIDASFSSAWPSWSKTDEGAVGFLNAWEASRNTSSSQNWSGTATFTVHFRQKVYSITYHTDGAAIPSGVTLPSSYNAGTGLPQCALPDLSKAGYVFGGWYDNAGFSGNPISSFTITSSDYGDKDFYAKFSTVEVVVVFDTNGGFLPDGTNYFKTVMSASAYGSLPTPKTRTGYTFAGWYTAAVGGTPITSSTVVTQTTDHVIYAHWTEIPATVTITFDAAGGTVSETTRQVTSGAPYGALPTPTRSGYGFVGWFTEMSGGSQVTASTVATDDAIVYAHWSVSTCTVTFDGNGGTPSASSKTYLEGMAYGSLPTASRTGYNFAGWFTAATGGSQVTASSTASARTLYAHWAARTGIGVMFYKIGG